MPQQCPTIDEGTTKAKCRLTNKPYHPAAFVIGGAFVILCVTGCGGSGERLVRVTGTATRHGKPVPSIAINFTPEKGLRSYALTDQDGRFKMVYSSGQEGVLAGNHKVWVQLFTAGAKDDPAQRARLAAQQKDPEIAQILKKYGNAETTPISLEIKEERDITLTLD
jgi:hypothetical protein